MYSESDIDTAVASGAISAGAAAALRGHVAASRGAPAVDEEHFRLITGFNDIFVTIAALLLLLAVAWISGGVAPLLGPAAAAAASWGLAEYFTRQRRMALPSIVLLLAFVGGVAGTLADAMLGSLAMFGDGHGGLRAAIVAALTAAAAWAHWQRFRVPITVAAGVAALVGVALALVLAAVPRAQDVLLWLLLLAGLCVFACAMWWDVSDRVRQTRRSDVAFWLHLLAAPMIVHPVFWLLGLTSGEASTPRALVVLLLYLGLGVVALAVDRRALLVSALGYVLYAISTLLKTFGAVSLGFAFTALIIGGALLLLSAFWRPARALVVALLPEAWQARLPVLDRALSPRPGA